MIICPDCHVTLADYQSCHACGWQYQTQENIPIYLSTKDKNDVLFRRYLENYHDISKDDLEESIQNTEYLKTQNEKLFSYLPNLDGLSVCEIGVGKGILLEQIFKGKPAKVIAIDISIPYLNMIRNNISSVNVIVANAENLPFLNEFDVIIAADIIEHVFNVGDFLFSVNQALKPGGHFIVKTPNNEDINMYSKRGGCKYDFVHLRNFTEKSLKKILIGAGFDVNETIYDGFYPTRKRAFIEYFSYINNQVERFFRERFATVHEVNKINNFLGNILMEPIEITMITTKRLELKQ